MKLSEAVKPISYVKANAAEIIEQVCETGNPVIVTQNGYAKVIIQDLKEYERTQETLALLELVRQGEEEIRTGNYLPAGKASAYLRKEIKRKYSDSKL